MSGTEKTPSGTSRRSVLKGGAAVAGVSASTAISGFPTIWAQNIKEIVIRHSGPPVTAIQRIAEQATKELGFIVQMQASENADLLNRFLSQSNTMDCADISLVYMRYLIGRNVLQAIPIAKAKHWDKTMPLFTKGESASGKTLPQQGITPLMILYATGPDGQKVTTRNADRLGHGRPYHHECRYAGHPARSRGSPDRELGRLPLPGIQRQSSPPGQSHDQHYRRRDGARGARRYQICEQRKYDERRGRCDDRQDDENWQKSEPWLDVL